MNLHLNYFKDAGSAAKCFHMFHGHRHLSSTKLFLMQNWQSNGINKDSGLPPGIQHSSTLPTATKISDYVQDVVKGES